jgi:hypothetical protein
MDIDACTQRPAAARQLSLSPLLALALGSVALVLIAAASFTRQAGLAS